MMRELISKFKEKSKPVPPRAEASLGYLRSWGLDRAITEEDDPELWAASLFRYWPAPTDPSLNVSELLFGVGDATYGTGLPAAAAAQEGELGDRELWRFMVIQDGGLQTVKAEDHEVSSISPRLSLLISRPSKGVDSVLVDHYRSEGPLSGQGASVVWEYSQRDKIWKPERVETVRMS